MPLSKSGREVMASMRKKYGAKAENVFYGTMQKMKMRGKWEGPKPKAKCEMVGRPMERGGEPCNSKFCR